MKSCLRRVVARAALGVLGPALVIVASSCGGQPRGYPYTAFGNRPVWSVTVWRDSIVFRQEEEPARIVFGGRWAVVSAGVMRWSTETESGPHHTLTLQLMRGRCRDRRLGERATLIAHAVLDSLEFSGCAREGIGPPPR